VLQHHTKSLTSGNLDEVAKDYTEDSVLFTPMETYKGAENIKSAFATMMKMLPTEALSNFKHTKEEIQGEYVYLLWGRLRHSHLPGIRFISMMAKS
jgi:ketosteroid isomerase-like protein